MSTETLPQDVAEVVTDRMRRSGFTQASLAHETNIPRTTLQRRLVDGEFSVLELVVIARAVGTTPEVLLSEARALRDAPAVNAS